MTSLAEDFRQLGMDPTGKPLNQLREDVQTSGHGTSYPSPGQVIKPGVRNPDDSKGETDPNHAEAFATLERRLRRSTLRREGADADMELKPEDDADGDPENEGDEEMPKAESRRRARRVRAEGAFPGAAPPFEDDMDQEEGDEEEPEDEDDDEMEGDEPEVEGRHAEGDEEEPKDEDDEEEPKGEDDMPPEKVDVGEVRIVMPKGKKIAECRRAAYRGAKSISESLKRDRLVQASRRRIGKIVESVFGVSRKNTKDARLAEIRALTEAIKAPTTRFDDFVDRFNAMANLDEALVVKFAELHGELEMPRRWPVSFKTLAEASLSRAADSAHTLREMSRIRSKRLTRAESNLLEERLVKFGKEQRVAFGALTASLASARMLESVDDLPGVEHEDDDEDQEESADAAGKNIGTMGDVPEDDDEIHAESASDDGKPYAEMDGDEIQKEMTALSKKMEAAKARMKECGPGMKEDGRMPTDDHLHDEASRRNRYEDTEEPINPELPYGESRLRPRTTPRRR
jgi:hypothetical protein